MPPPRVYADTSVFGGVHDEEFSESSRSFLDQVRAGRFHLVISAIVREEIAPAPIDVRSTFEGMLLHAEVAEVGQAALQLREAYLDAGILSASHSGDALHVAVATVAGCAVIVSWNFRHIVHYEKIRLYNAVNALHGFGSLDIHSPNEVIAYEDEDL